MNGYASHRVARARLLLITIMTISAAGTPAGALDETPAPGTAARPVSGSAVTVTDGFWAPRFQTNREVTLPFVLDRCRTTGRLDNFARAAGVLEGKHEGYFFNDSDVYKVIEGAARSLRFEDEPGMAARIKDLVRIIAKAQQEDGYLNTYYTLKEPDRRWTDLRVMHELYCAGHLFEAAVELHERQGDRTLLDVACKLADHIGSVFGEKKRRDVPGHEEIELGLVKLYRATGERRHLELASFFLEERGRKGRDLYGDYCQDHLPVREQEAAVGHAVRAAYLYAAMTDVALETGDATLLAASRRLWKDVVRTKLYLTGGIGARRRGEAFGAAYELPNESAYSETCAAIANALWNHRLLLVDRDARHADVLELILYNGFLAGVSLTGDRFFYPNPLAADGVTPFNQGSTGREPWFACACCPVNVVRFLPSIPELVYSRFEDTLYVNLFVSSDVRIEVAGKKVDLSLTTRYPWSGDLLLEVNPEEEIGPFTVAVRIPGWVEGSPVPGDLYASLPGKGSSPDPVSLLVNARPARVTTERGYLRLRREWKPGDVVELRLPLPARRIVSHPAVEANRGRVALMRGPIVYCLEGIDHDGSVHSLSLPDPERLRARHRDDLLGGVTVLEGKGLRRTAKGSEEVGVTAVPYHVWNHRGAGEMAVWIPRTLEGARALPAPTKATRSVPSASHCFAMDTVRALNDRKEPSSSIDHSIPRMTWWDHRGTREWAQYELPEKTSVSRVRVYWFDDTGRGACRVPGSCRVLYRSGKEFVPVRPGALCGVEKDRYNELAFDPVTTTALRLEVELEPGFSAGILEWEVD